MHEAYLKREEVGGRGSRIFLKELCPLRIYNLNMRLGSDLVHDSISPRAPYLKRKEANYVDS